jgi:hypothetical protein
VDIHTYYMIQSSLFGVIELIGVGAAVGLYVSDRRAKTEADHYIYSPTRKPTSRTPKLAFIPLPLVVTTLIATDGIMEVWQKQLNPTGILIGKALIAICGIGGIVAAALLVWTTRPLEEPPADTRSENSSEEEDSL